MSLKINRRTFAAVTVAALMSTAAGAALAQSGEYPRNETLYMSGAQWGNIVGFNPYFGNFANGLIGLCNETLFRYDPIADKYIDWLAEKGEWTSPTVFKLTIRSGIKWSDGEDFTANDVKWNIDLGALPTIWWTDLYKSIKSVEAEGNTVTVTFDGTPNYQAWQNAVWNIPMMKPSQWKDHANEKEITSWTPDAPIGTGPYVFDKAGYDPTTRVVWMKTPEGWWASKAGISPDPKPKYIIDLVNSSNNVALGLLLAGKQDLNNNFLPGVATLIAGGYGLHTYYDKAPYMLPAVTSWLLPNTTRAPLSDSAFRRALAFSINTDQIAKVDYGSVVLPASPTGLLPAWDKYIDKDAVKKHGFGYDPKKAADILVKAGYKKGSDGFFKTPKGEPIDLKIEVPSGWSDWMQAVQMISADAKAVGIKITPKYPDFNTYQSERNTGNFDLMIENSQPLSDTPYTYYRYLYQLPVLSSQTNYNFARFEDKKAWDLTVQLAKTPRSDIDKMKEITAKLQVTFMDELPMIPLWYNGAWAQMSTTTWKNWPADGTDRQYIPISWRGWFQMTGLDTITHLEPAGQ